MHEWALAEGIILTTLKIANEKNNANIRSINIKLGSLQQIDLEIFSFALDQISSGTPAEKSDKKIDIENAVLGCRVCDKNWEFEDSKKGLGGEESESIHFIPDLAHSYIRCPDCGSPDFEIKSGRGVWLDSIELESD